MLLGWGCTIWCPFKGHCFRLHRSFDRLNGIIWGIYRISIQGLLGCTEGASTIDHSSHAAISLSRDLGCPFGRCFLVRFCQQVVSGQGALFQLSGSFQRLNLRVPSRPHELPILWSQVFNTAITSCTSDVV